MQFHSFTNPRSDQSSTKDVPTPIRGALQEEKCVYYNMKKAGPRGCKTPKALHEETLDGRMPPLRLLHPFLAFRRALGGRAFLHLRWRLKHLSPGPLHGVFPLRLPSKIWLWARPPESEKETRFLTDLF